MCTAWLFGPSNPQILMGLLAGTVEPWRAPPTLPRMTTPDGREVAFIGPDGRELRRVANLSFDPNAPDPWKPPPVPFELVRAFHGWAMLGPSAGEMAGMRWEWP